MTRTDETGAKDERVLVVDDDHLVREVIVRAFKQRGYVVEGFPRAEPALERFREAPFDLVVSDLQMPGMGGLELLQAIRREKGGEIEDGAVFIVITAYGDLETARKTLKHGALDYLSKPIDLLDFLARAEHALSHLRLRRTARRRAIDLEERMGKVAERLSEARRALAAIDGGLPAEQRDRVARADRAIDEALRLAKEPPPPEPTA